MYNWKYRTLYSEQNSLLIGAMSMLWNGCWTQTFLHNYNCLNISRQVNTNIAVESDLSLNSTFLISQITKIISITEVYRLAGHRNAYFCYKQTLAFKSIHLHFSHFQILCGWPFLYFSFYKLRIVVIVFYYAKWLTNLFSFCYYFWSFPPQENVRFFLLQASNSPVTPTEMKHMMSIFPQWKGDCFRGLSPSVNFCQGTPRFN